MQLTVKNAVDFQVNQLKKSSSSRNEKTINFLVFGPYLKVGGPEEWHHPRKYSNFFCSLDQSRVSIGAGRDAERFDPFVEQLTREPIEIGLIAQRTRFQILASEIGQGLFVACLGLVAPELNV